MSPLLEHDSCVNPVVGDMSSLEMRDMAVAVSGDVAFCHSFTRLHGVEAGGQPFDMWARSTLCLRKQDDGQWRIVHGHTSVPFAMDGSFRAQVDLKP